MRPIGCVQQLQGESVKTRVVVMVAKNFLFVCVCVCPPGCWVVLGGNVGKSLHKCICKVLFFWLILFCSASVFYLLFSVSHLWVIRNTENVSLFSDLAPELLLSWQHTSRQLFISSVLLWICFGTFNYFLFHSLGAEDKICCSGNSET